MRIIKCDRCGAIIPKDQDSVGYVSIRMRVLETEALSGDNSFEDWDLCDDCLKAIHQFITEPKAQAKKEKHEQILDSVGAGKKAKEPKQPGFDVGKAQALRNAQPITWIAQEMGVSEPTIRKYTVPAPPKKEKPLEWAEHEPDLDPVIKETVETKPFRALETAEA